MDLYNAAMNSDFNVSSVAIVGVGLIGGSVAAGLRARGYSGKIRGVGRNADRLQKAVEAGLLDGYTTSLREHASELVIVCTPVDRIAKDVRLAAENALPETVMTDVGSVKGVVCRELKGELPGGATFIGSHPLAGSHHQGFEHADPNLFDGRVCVVTPTEDNHLGIGAVRACWELLGMKTVTMSPDKHDEILAMTSHLPHLVAAALAGALEDSESEFAATGFADTTRIAAGEPSLWVPILRQNSAAVLASIQRFQGQLDDLRAALETGDGGVLGSLLATAQANRNSLPHQ